MAWEVLLRGSRALTIRLVHRPSSQRTKAGLLLLVVVFLVYWRVLLWHNIMTPVFWRLCAFVGVSPCPEIVKGPQAVLLATSLQLLQRGSNPEKDQTVADQIKLTPAAFQQPGSGLVTGWFHLTNWQLLCSAVVPLMTCILAADAAVPCKQPYGQASASPSFCGAGYFLVAHNPVILLDSCNLAGLKGASLTGGAIYHC